MELGAYFPLEGGLGPYALELLSQSWVTWSSSFSEREQSPLSSLNLIPGLIPLVLIDRRLKWILKQLFSNSN